MCFRIFHISTMSLVGISLTIAEQDVLTSCGQPVIFHPHPAQRHCSLSARTQSQVEEYLTIKNKHCNLAIISHTMVTLYDF